MEKLEKFISLYKRLEDHTPIFHALPGFAGTVPQPLTRAPHMLKRPPSPAAVRQRRFKARQRNGEIVVTITLSPAETDTLYQIGCLDIDKLENRRAIVEALHLALAHSWGR